MTPRNRRRTRAFLLVPIAALTTTVATLEVRDGASTPSIRSDAATTAASPDSSGSEPLAAPTTVSTPPPVATAPGAVSAPASVTRGGGAVEVSGLPPLRARLAGPTTGSGDTAVDAASTGMIAPVALAAYQRAASVIDQAAAGCRLDWQLLAAIGQVESGNGTAGGSRLSTAGVATPAIYGPVLNGRRHTARVLDTDSGTIDDDTRFDRAVGPMQILPATWVQIAVDGDGDGRRDPQDINDAALASAVYLCSTGTDLSDADARRAALLRYNHSTSYASEVLALAATYSADDASTTVPAALLLPPGTGPSAADGTPAGSAPGKHRHHGKRGHRHEHGHGHRGHHQATGIKPEPSATQAGPQPAQAPTSTPSPSTPGAATAAQLDKLCRTTIVATYPNATAGAVGAATTACVHALTGRTLPQAQGRLDDVLADVAPTVPGLGPAVTPTPVATGTPTPTDPPSGSPAGSPTGAPSGAPVGTSPDTSPGGSSASTDSASTDSSTDAPQADTP